MEDLLSLGKIHKFANSFGNMLKMYIELFIEYSKPEGLSLQPRFNYVNQKFLTIKR